MLLVVTWFLIGLLVGTAGVFLGPLLLAAVGGNDLQERAGRWYISTTMTLLGSAALVAKSRGGVALRPTSSDPKLEGDELTVDGETGHLADDYGVKSYLTGNEFGIATDTAPSYVTPLLAELGEAAAAARHRDRIGVQPDGGVRLDFELPRREQLADIDRARHVLAGSADLRTGVVAENWAKISQEKFHQNLGIKETLLLVGSFAAGVGLALVLSRYGGDAGGATQVPVGSIVGVLL